MTRKPFLFGKRTCDNNECKTHLEQYIQSLNYLSEKQKQKQEIDIVTELTRNIWNKIIAEPKNEKGSFNFSPEKLRKVIEETISTNQPNFKEH